MNQRYSALTLSFAVTATDNSIAAAKYVRHKLFSKLLLGVFVFLVMGGEKSWGQVSLTNGSNTAAINFSNSMPTSVGTNASTAFTAAGFESNPTTAGRLNSNAWAVTGWSDGSLAFGGTRTTVTTDYTRGSTAAAVITGGFYAFTGSPASVSNPTFMIQPGGSDFAPGTMTLKIKNDGTTNITSLAVSYNIYIRNDQARSNSFNFSYSTDDAAYTAVGGLDYTSTAALDALGWVIVGTAPSRSTTITGLNVAPGSFIYIRWSSADVGGSGSRDEFGLDDISLNATFCVAPSITSATAALNPICSNATTTLTANNVAGTGAVVTWWTATGGTGTQVGTGNTSNPVGPGTYFSYVQGTCGTAEASVIVGSVAAPTANAGTTPTTICANGTYVVAGSSVTNNASFTWSTSGNGTFSPNNTTMAPTYTPGTTDKSNGTVTITLTAVGNSPCANATSTKVLTIVAAPTANAGITPTNICANGTYVVAGSSVANNASFTWTTTGDGTFSPNNNSSLTPTYTPGTTDKSSGTVTITLTAVGNSPCANATSPKVLTINALPTLTCRANMTRCIDAPFVELSGSSPAGGTYTGPGVDGSNNFTAATAGVGVHTITYTYTDPGTGCSNTCTFTITVVATPTANAGTTPTTICANGTYVVAGSSVTNNASFTWTTNGDGTFSPNDNSSLTPIYIPGTNDKSSGTVTITLTAVGNTPCGSTTDSKIIAINPLPPTSTITVTNSTCQLGCTVGGGSFTITPCTGSTMTFYDDASGLNPTTTSPVYQQETAMTIYYACVDATTGCRSAIQSLTTLPGTCPGAPAAPLITATNSTCQSGCTVGGGSFNVTTTCGAGTTLTYYTDNTGATTTGAPTYNQTTPMTIYYACVDNTTGCRSAIQTLTTVPGTCTIPSAPLITATESTCQSGCTLGGGSFNVTTACGAGITLTYYTDNTGATTTGAPTYDQNSPMTIYYACVNTVTGCRSAIQTLTTVPGTCIIPATPTITAGGITTFCSGGSVTLTSNSASGNQWRLDGNPIGGATAQNYIASVAGDYTVIVTSALGCSSAPSVATRVTVYPNPASSTITVVESTCQSGCTVGGGSITANPCSGSVMTFYDDATGANPTTTVPTYNQTTPITIYYACVNTTTGCRSTIQTVITVPGTCTLPGAPTGSAAQSLCAGSTVAALTATGSNIQWYSLSSGGGALPPGTPLTTATIYYASQTVGFCESTARFAVTVTLLPAVNVGSVNLIKVNHLVMSQIYGGGGNSGAVYKNDFIEIFNPTGNTITVAGWSVQYASSAGTTWAVTNLSGSIAAGKYYLVQQAAGAGGTTNLPTPDATGTIAMSASAGKVALVSSTTALSGACPSGGSIVDFIGYGSAASCSETAVTATLTNTTAAIRADAGCTDLNNNSIDFATAGAPTPRNSATAANICPGTSIETICSGSIPGSMSATGATGGSGTFSYQWYSRSGNTCPSGIDISGWTALTASDGTGFNTITFTPSVAVTSTTRFACLVTPGGSPVCGVPTWASGCRTVLVNSVTGGTIAEDQSICPSGDPAPFTETVASTGSTLTYQWQSSTVNNFSSAVTTIGGATSTTYDAPSGLGVTTYYRRITTSTLNAIACTANSNIITVTISAGPEMNVTGLGIGIPDGFSSPILSNHTDFGSVSFCTGTIIRTFTIQNTGSSNLNLGSINIADPSGTASFIVTSTPISPVVPGGNTFFQVTFNPSIITGLISGTIIINNDDCDENPYNFAIQGTGVDPEIDIKGNSVSITDGDVTPSLSDHTDFGNVLVSTPFARTYTISNSGTSNLTIGAGAIATIGGDASMFVVSGYTVPVIIAPAGSAAIEVTFTPTSLGLKTTTLNIATNDCDENPYNFSIQGTGISCSITRFGTGSNIQAVCPSTPITNITYNTTGATGASFSGLPPGVNGNWASNVVTISGAPNTSVGSPFNYIITLTGGGCGSITATGTITVFTLPALFNITGGGAYCSTDTPNDIGLSGSEEGVSYQLFNGITPIGTPKFGTGSALNFGPQPLVGTYTIVATRLGCTRTMTGTVTVSIFTCGVSITDPCTCLNNATTLTDGQFGETVTVMGPSGDTWLVTAVTGFYTAGSPAPPAAPILIGLGTPMIETIPGVSGVYNLDGRHIDAIGYSITVTNRRGLSLTIGNLCSYPNPTINGLAPVICASATPITLTGTPGDATIVSQSFTVNGLPATQLNLATPGIYNIVYTVNGGVALGADPGCIQSVSQSVTVSALPTLLLNSGNNIQTICITPGVQDISYTAGGGATSVTVIGLPPGVTNAGTFPNVLITGTPTAPGVYNYTVTTNPAAPCFQAVLTGTITVQALPSLDLTSGNNIQTVCINLPLISINYLVKGSATGVLATGLPPGLSITGVYPNFSITGSPTTAGIYNYTIQTLPGGPCPPVQLRGTITVMPAIPFTLDVAGTNIQNVCINMPIIPIGYTFDPLISGGGFGGFPPGINLSTIALPGGFNQVVFSGTPTTAGVFNYFIQTGSGSCFLRLTGTITVQAVPVITQNVAGANFQSVCINSAIAPIAYSISGGATGTAITAGALPLGVTLSGNTISGTPTVAGVYNYTITTTPNGPCTPVSLTGTITVVAAPTLTQNIPGANIQTVCINTAISPIAYTIGGTATGTAITAGALPAGVTLVGNTISGVPTVSGVFTYTISTTPPAGTCTPVSLTGTITVQSLPTISLSIAGTNTQVICLKTPITNISYTIGGGATGTAITAGVLPPGVTLVGNTISGLPIAAGVFNYTISTLPAVAPATPCTRVSLTGTITVLTDATITLTSGPANQVICNGVAITPVVYTVGGAATGAAIIAGALPAGITGVYAAGPKTFTISGTPTVSGIFNYSVSATGSSCVNPTLDGSINVSPAINGTITAAGIIQICNGQTAAVNVVLTGVPNFSGTLAISLLNGIGVATPNLPFGPLVNSAPIGAVTVAGPSSITIPAAFLTNTSAGVTTFRISWFSATSLVDANGCSPVFGAPLTGFQDVVVNPGTVTAATLTTAVDVNGDVCPGTNLVFSVTNPNLIPGSVFDWTAVGANNVLLGGANNVAFGAGKVDNNFGLTCANIAGINPITFTFTPVGGGLLGCVGTPVPVLVNVRDQMPPVNTNGNGNATFQCGESALIVTARAFVPTFNNTNCSGVPVVTSAVGEVYVPSCGYSAPYVAGQTGTLTTTWIATEPCGQQSTVTQVITITDNANSTWTTAVGSLNRTIQCGNNAAAFDAALAVAQALVPTATDGVAPNNCTPDAFLVGTRVKTSGVFAQSNPGTCTTAGTYTNTFMTTDRCGNNSILFTQVITIVDNTPPTLGDPGPQTLDVGAGIGCTVPLPDYTGMVTYTDCTPRLSMSQNPIAGTPLLGAGGAQVVRVTMSDGCGNTSFRDITVNLVDITPPIARCHPITVSLSATIGAGSVNVIPSQIDGNGNGPSFDPKSSDNCGLGPINGGLTFAGGSFPAGNTPINRTYITCANLGANNITLVVTDANGNTATCSTTITVVDITPPVITCAPPVIFQKNSSCVTIMPNLIGIGQTTAVDNVAGSPGCPPVTITQSPAAGTIIAADVTSVPVVFTATDGSGNGAICITTVEFRDQTAPVLANCPTSFTVNTGAGNTDCNVAVTWTPPTVTDNCSPLLGATTLTSTHTPGQLFFAGITTVTYIATDAAGNSTSCSFNVTVVENTLPSITCSSPGNKVVNPNSGCTYTHGNTNWDATGTDNCIPSPTIFYTLAGATVATGTNGQSLNGRAFNAGVTTVTWRVVDQSTNSVTCSFTVTVIDTQVPTITCPAPVAINTNAAGCKALVPAALTTPVFADNCPTGLLLEWSVSGATPISSGIGPIGNYTFNIGTSIVTYRVSDASGNSTICSFNVVVTNAVTGTVTGTATVAQNAVATSTITFTGLNGQAPYTFTYNVNGGGTQTITTPGVSNTTTIAQSNALLGVFVYNLLTVTDANGCAQTPAPVAQSATITVANGTPDLSAGQFFNTTQIAAGGFIDEVVSIRNLGTVATSDQVVFTITTYSALTGINISLNPNPAIILGFTSFNLDNSNWSYNAHTGTFTSNPGVIINPGAGNARHLGIRITRPAAPNQGANGSTNHTVTITNGTGGGETPTSNNSISNILLKN